MAHEEHTDNPFSLETTHAPSEPGPGGPPPGLVVSKSRVPAEVEGRPTEIELFTLTLECEAIYLLPLKTWSQLDVYKWRARGKLPGTPPGLEIGIDSVKVGGECVSTTDPDGCAKLERAFNEWLELERQALGEERRKSDARASQSAVSPPPEEALRFRVEPDKMGQPHIRCIEGRDVVADVACTTPGIASLLNEGLMRKPANWKVGALRDWVELDGRLFRFNDGPDGLAALERTLNEQYHPAGGGAAQEVKVFPNPASTSGFDIEFPAAENGLVEIRRRHLDPHAMELLSDPHRCRVLRKGLVVKFTPPTFHFKRKTADGGEQNLDGTADNKVLTAGENGQNRWIDLSRPVSHLGLDAPALTAIFNHRSICRRVRRDQGDDWAKGLDQAA